MTANPRPPALPAHAAACSSDEGWIRVAYAAGLPVPPIPSPPTTSMRADAVGDVVSRTIKVSLPVSCALPGHDTAAYAGEAPELARTGPTSACTAPEASVVPTIVAASSPEAATPITGRYVLTMTPESKRLRAAVSRVPGPSGKRRERSVRFATRKSFRALPKAPF